MSGRERVTSDTPARNAATVSARVDDHKPLASVGLVCPCGKALASMEGVVRRCECGRLWQVTVMQIGGPDA